MQLVPERINGEGALDFSFSSWTTQSRWAPCDGDGEIRYDANDDHDEHDVLHDGHDAYDVLNVQLTLYCPSNGGVSKSRFQRALRLQMHLAPWVLGRLGCLLIPTRRLYSLLLQP